MAKYLKYPHVISSAVSPEVHEMLVTDQKTLDISISKLIRNILETYYEILEVKKYYLHVSDDEAKELKAQGFNIEEQE